MKEILKYKGTNKPFKLYGASKGVWNSKEQEIFIVGPYETSKTFACLQKVHYLASKYPNSLILITKNRSKDLQFIIPMILENVIWPQASRRSFKIEKYIRNKNRVERYVYENGSVILLVSIDNLEKIYGTEFDFTYINQAEEISEEEWNFFCNRTLRHSKSIPHPQVIGDCNPSNSDHWILKRKNAKTFNSRHQDNPILFDHKKGEFTDRGQQTLKALSKLTGVHRLRGYFGIWCDAEN